MVSAGGGRRGGRLRELLESIGHSCSGFLTAARTAEREHVAAGADAEEV